MDHQLCSARGCFQLQSGSLVQVRQEDFNECEEGSSLSKSSAVEGLFACSEDRALNVSRVGRAHGHEVLLELPAKCLSRLLHQKSWRWALRSTWESMQMCVFTAELSCTRSNNFNELPHLRTDTQSD